MSTDWHKRYRSLRQCLPHATSFRAVNHDWTDETSTFPQKIPFRKFFLGEIFSTHSGSAALVTRKQPSPNLPVEMAPAIPHPPDGSWTFTTHTGDPLPLHFALFYRRPYLRHEILSHQTTLSPQEKQRLSTELFPSLLE